MTTHVVPSGGKYDLPPEFTALLATPLDTALDQLLPLPLTANGSGHLFPSDPLSDLFNSLVPGIHKMRLYSVLNKAWIADPRSTLRIVLAARNIHDCDGKNVFLHCISFLFETQPRAILANLHFLVDSTSWGRHEQRDDCRVAEPLSDSAAVEDTSIKDPYVSYGQAGFSNGSFDDLNDILMLAMNGQLTTSSTSFSAVGGTSSRSSQAVRRFKKARLANKSNLPKKEVKKMRRAGYSAMEASLEEGNTIALAKWKEQGIRSSPPRYRAVNGTSVMEMAAEYSTPRSTPLDVVTAQLLKCRTKEMRATLVKERAAIALRDPKISALYLTIVDLYVKDLSSDLSHLAQHRKYISLPKKQRVQEGYDSPGSSPHLTAIGDAAKWAPTPGKSMDQNFFLAIALSLRFFPHLEVKIARQRFMAEVLVPIRRVLPNLVPTKAKGKWKAEYSTVGSFNAARFWSPEYQPTYMEYSALSPLPGVSFPAFEPTFPRLRGSSPECRASSPEYRASSPVFRASSPVYQPPSPQYQAAFSTYGTSYQEYRGASPAFRASSPDYNPESPV